MRCRPRDGGTDLASTASDLDSDLKQTQDNKYYIVLLCFPLIPLCIVIINAYQ